MLGLEHSGDRKSGKTDTILPGTDHHPMREIKCILASEIQWN